MTELISATDAGGKRSNVSRPRAGARPDPWRGWRALWKRFTRNLRGDRAGGRLMPYLVLSGGFAALLVRGQKRLGHLEQEHQSLRREAEVAAEIQRATLPAPPPHPLLETAVRYEPAKEVGGDFYSFFASGSRLGLIVGDVAGKGIPAALVSTSICHLARWLRPMQDPGGFLAKMNQELLEQLPSETYASMVSVLLDPDADQVLIYNAGHPPGLLVSGDQVRRVQQTNLPLGLFPNVAFVPETVPFRSGDTLVLYSDAFIEARDRNGEELEVDGFEALVRRHAGLPPEELASRLVEETRAFGAVTDDLTLVVVRLRQRQTRADPVLAARRVA